MFTNSRPCCNSIRSIIAPLLFVILLAVFSQALSAGRKAEDCAWERPPKIVPEGQTSKRQQPLDFIEFPTPEKPDFSKQITESYAKGLSTRDIARLIGCSATSVKNTLRRLNVITRPVGVLPTTASKLHGGKLGSRPYYGFCYFEGKLVKHPIEFPVLQMIHDRWMKGISAHHIACELNNRKIVSRQGREWCWAAVTGILKRFKTGDVVIKGSSFNIKQIRSDTRLICKAGNRTRK